MISQPRGLSRDRSLIDQATDQAQSIAATGQRLCRLETQVASGQVRIVSSDVGRVADNQVEKV